MPVGALVARYENAVRLVVHLDPTGITRDQLTETGAVYEDAETVQWFWGIESGPDFEFLYQTLEDKFGNVL